MAKQRRASSRPGRPKPLPYETCDRSRGHQGAAPGLRRGGGALRAGRGRPPSTRVCPGLLCLAVGALPLSCREGTARAGPSVSQHLRPSHGATGRVALDAGGAGLCRDPGRQRRDFSTTPSSICGRRARSRRTTTTRSTCSPRCWRCATKSDAAVPVLLRAIELNPDNRAMARHDPDLERLRQYDTVRAALDASTPATSERRKARRRSR